MIPRRFSLIPILKSHFSEGKMISEVHGFNVLFVLYQQIIISFHIKVQNYKSDRKHRFQCFIFESECPGVVAKTDTSTEKS